MRLRRQSLLVSDQQRKRVKDMDYTNYFDQMVQRTPANMKMRITPPEILTSGNISFDGAEPDFPTAPCIEEAVIKVAKNGLYGFTWIDDKYRAACVWWMKSRRDTTVDPDWIVPTYGTIRSVATLIRMLPSEKCGLIVTSPIYNRYAQASKRLNKPYTDVPMILKDGRYYPDFDGIEKAMATGNYGLFILCNPQNPTGQIWSADEMTKLSELCNKYGIVVFDDEIFADNVYEGNPVTCYLNIPGAREHAVNVLTLGKNFHMTGVNHSNMIIPNPALREKFTQQRTADHYGSMDPISYEMTLAAFTPDGAQFVDAENEYVGENIRYIKDFFHKNLPDIPVCGGEGGYILWLDWRNRFDSEENLEEFLYKKAFFHVDMGSNYGQALFTRMCVASPKEYIVKALESLKKAALAEGWYK